MQIGSASVNISSQSLRQFEKSIANEINKKMVLAAKILNTKTLSSIKTILKEALFLNPTIQEILHGDLAGHFGLSDSNRTVSGIIEELIKEVRLKAKTITKVDSGVRYKGLSVQLYAFLADYSQILGLDIATTHSKGGDLPWLKHLLLDGDKIIIQDWSIRFGNFTKSRSGQAIMINNGGYWRIPVYWSGLAERNFITNVIDSTTPEIESLILASVEEAFS